MVATVRTMSAATSGSRPQQDDLAKLLTKAAVDAGLVPGQPDDGGASGDSRADGDDDNPGGIDDLPDPDDYVVIVHVAPPARCR